MFHELCFLIRPKKRLMDLLDHYVELYDPDVVMELREPSVWIGKADSYTNPLYEALKIKLLFLAILYEDSSESTHMGFRKLVKEILGEPPYQASIFDTWWDLMELYESPIRYGDVDKYIVDRHTLKLMSRTGNMVVDAWLEKLVVEKTQSKKFVAKGDDPPSEANS